MSWLFVPTMPAWNGMSAPVVTGVTVPSVLLVVLAESAGT